MYSNGVFGWKGYYSYDSGVGVDAGGFITGAGVKPGTSILGHSANGLSTNQYYVDDVRFTRE